ncbi:MAG: bifunctional alpha,alpha-trehalose-phosphate synthase (UDP-forming)/trehalose-phosphatase [Dehalococcoidia bacterium]
MSRLILISNRLPVTVKRERRGEQELSSSSGGLVAGLDPLHSKGDGLWLGHPGEQPNARTCKILEERRLVPVSVPASEYRGFYQGYSNNAIWPLFHYLIERSRFDASEFEAYRRVNERFADAVAEHSRPDDTIWVHDYQLMLLPEMIRERVPGARIGFFLHIPFPSSEILRVLPEREQILRGLLGADLIGVHTYEYADHMLRSIRRILGLESRQGSVRVNGRTVRVESHPLGIDVKSLRDRAFSESAERRLARLKRGMGDRQVILGVDRLDYTKGITFKLEAYRRLLASSRRWREGVVLVQVAVPSRENIESYRQQKDEVERLVGEINGLYGRPGRVPIHYVYRSIPPEELGALYRMADVLFVTPVRDGLNLVAKEYVACRDDGGGVLVLSEFAGAATELGEGLRVNPWDVIGTAQKLERALEMDFGERNQRMMAMYRRVVANDVHRWVDRFMRSLLQPGEPIYTAPPLLESEVLAATISSPFAHAESPLIMLDYDGSLREFTDRYEDAVPTREIMEILTELSALPDVHLFINSGRDRNTLGEWFSDMPISLIAEHGSWIRYRGADEWAHLGSPPDVSWKEKARPVLQEYVDRTPGARIEEKSSSLVWHYREAEVDLGEWQALELASLLENMLSSAPVEILTGARIVEIRQQGLDKGRAYDFVKRQYGPFDFVLATGDDRTDEDLFSRLEPEAFSVRVGGGGSRATTAVSSPASMRRLLRALIRARTAVAVG